MKVAVICEYSGTVRDAFIKAGHEAVSFDILPSESSLGEHVQRDIMEIPKEYWEQFDLAICHPPCTYLTVTGNKWYYHPEDKELPLEDRRPHPKFPNRVNDREEAVRFFMYLSQLPVEKIAIENPVGIISTRWRKPDQIIQPYEYGHVESKKTCLWLKNLPKLVPTKIMNPDNITYENGKTFGKWYAWKSAKERSKTFEGIADAMAEQWGKLNVESEIIAFDVINDYLNIEEKLEDSVKETNFSKDA